MIDPGTQRWAQLFERMKNIPHRPDIASDGV